MFVQTDKVLASDDVGKQEAAARKHESKAEAEAQKDQKKVDNEQEKNELKQDINTRQAAADDAYKNVDTGVRDHTTT
jgi:hypothetical protein